MLYMYILYIWHFLNSKFYILYMLHISTSILLLPNLCYEFGLPKFFSQTFNFPFIFTQLGKFWGEANVEKHADPGKKNRKSRKSRENSRNLLEAFLRSRKEENLYGHCAMNNARRILSKLWRDCWVWSKKLHFQENFGRNFIAVGGVTERYRNWISWYPHLRRDVVFFCIWAVLRSLQQRILRGRGSKPDIWPSYATKNCVVICRAFLLYEMGYPFRSTVGPISRTYLYLWNFRTFFVPS